MALTRTPPVFPPLVVQHELHTDFADLSKPPPSPSPPTTTPQPTKCVPQPQPTQRIQRTTSSSKSKLKPVLSPDEEHVTIWNRRERRKIAGNAAPLRKNVARYLAEHPHCEEYKGQDAKIGKPKKAIKRKRPATSVVTAVIAAATASTQQLPSPTTARTFTSPNGRCYDARKCRLMRCGIHADLHPSLLGAGSCPDADALADPATFDSDFAAMLRTQAADLAEPPTMTSPAKGFATPLPAELVLEELPSLCFDFSDEESLVSLLC